MEWGSSVNATRFHFGVFFFFFFFFGFHFTGDMTRRHTNLYFSVFHVRRGPGVLQRTGDGAVSRGMGTSGFQGRDRHQGRR